MKRKKNVVFPPPRRYVRVAGTPMRMPPRRIFEKLSFPGPSAGSGALWMAEDFRGFSELEHGKEDNSKY
jgi:hypothetical protein